MRAHTHMSKSTYKHNPSLIQKDQAFLCTFACVHNSKEDFAAHKAPAPPPLWKKQVPRD